MRPGDYPSFMQPGYAGGGPVGQLKIEAQKREHERYTPFHVKRNVMTHQFENFATGGYVSGPGGPMDDKVPATIDGQQPARLSNGEFVLPVHAVKAIGGGDHAKGTKILQDFLARLEGRPSGIRTL